MKLSVSQAMLGFLYSHDWTGTLREGLLGKCCCDFFSFLFRKVGNNSLIIGREPGVGPYDPFCPRMLPNLFGLPLGGSIDSTSLLFKRNFRNNNFQLILHFCHLCIDFVLSVCPQIHPRKEF